MGERAVKPRLEEKSEESAVDWNCAISLSMMKELLKYEL